jgi:hypothetical protein
MAVTSGPLLSYSPWDSSLAPVEQLSSTGQLYQLIDFVPSALLGKRLRIELASLPHSLELYTLVQPLAYPAYTLLQSILQTQGQGTTFRIDQRSLLQGQTPLLSQSQQDPTILVPL